MMTALIVIAIVYSVMLYLIHLVAMLTAVVIAVDAAPKEQRQAAYQAKMLVIAFPAAPIALPVLLIKWLDARIYAP